MTVSMKAAGGFGPDQAVGAEEQDMHRAGSVGGWDEMAGFAALTICTLGK